MTTTAQEELSAARAEAQELQDHIDRLEAQVREGDEREAAEELGRAFGLRRLVQLRQEAAERKVARAQAEEAGRRRLAAVAGAEADLTQLGIDRLAVAFTQAVEALEQLARLGDTRQDAIERHGRAFVDLGLPIRHHDGGWIVFEVNGTVYDTHQDHCDGARLLRLVQEELERRKAMSRRLDLGFAPPEPLPHPVTQYIDGTTESPTAA
ncbi:hypothetical protein ACFZBZ_45785 [Streptomyces sp. NPDC008196]|uniref:hypothetical protein n=1 Tax=Streptomyces sp. NPDC008196 TaxID=3364819 RepID=UPI0036F0F049